MLRALQQLVQQTAARCAQASLLALMCVAAVPTHAQTAPAKDPACSTPTSGKADAAKSAPCPQPTHPPSVSAQFPYPGETPPAANTDPAANQFPYPGEPTAEVPKPTTSPAADRFPYPGEKPAESGSSSSSATTLPDPEAKSPLKDEGSEGEAQPHRRRLRPQAQKTLSDDERVEEDLSIAHFYQQSGNLMGAYLRAKDAVKLQPQSGDTHLALAEAADRLGKRDEAIAEYRAALAADLDPPDAKTAHKALDRLNP